MAGSVEIRTGPSHTVKAEVRGHLQLRTKVGIWSSKGKEWIVVPVGCSAVELQEE